MPKGSHINVTVDFRNCSDGVYDLRIPAHQPIKQLLLNLFETLQLDMTKVTRYAVKIPTKKLLLTDDDRLEDYPVTDGDILIVL